MRILLSALVAEVALALGVSDPHNNLVASCPELAKKCGASPTSTPDYGCMLRADPSQQTPTCQPVLKQAQTPAPPAAVVNHSLFVNHTNPPNPWVHPSSPPPPNPWVVNHTAPMHPANPPPQQPWANHNKTRPVNKRHPPVNRPLQQLQTMLAKVTTELSRVIEHESQARINSTRANMQKVREHIREKRAAREAARNASHWEHQQGNSSHWPHRQNSSWHRGWNDTRREAKWDARRAYREHVLREGNRTRTNHTVTNSSKHSSRPVVNSWPHGAMRERNESWSTNHSSRHEQPTHSSRSSSRSRGSDDDDDDNNRKSSHDQRKPPKQTSHRVRNNSTKTKNSTQPVLPQNPQNSSNVNSMPPPQIRLHP